MQAVAEKPVDRYRRVELCAKQLVEEIGSLAKKSSNSEWMEMSGLLTQAERLSKQMDAAIAKWRYLTNS